MRTPTPLRPDRDSTSPDYPVTTTSPLRTTPGQLSPAQRTALGGAILLALALATYGAVGSYETISTLAASVGVPLPALVPLGIDGGLVGVVTLDLVLAWTQHPLGWLRQLARLLTIGTVAANVSAGWPDPLAIGLHAAAPLMLLAMVEAGRAVLLRRAGLESGIARDRIPCGRWMLSPWRTWMLWRRMVLWQITDYHTALQQEARLRRAHTLLRVQFGRRWKRKAPADVIWMLGIAPFADEACTRINTLTGLTMPDHEPTTASSTPTDPDDNSDLFEQAVHLNEVHWQRRGRPASAETVRKHLRVGAGRARELTTAVRAQDRLALQRTQTESADWPNRIQNCDVRKPAAASAQSSKR